MKKTFAIILTVIMVLGLAGCQSTPAPSSSVGSAPAPAPAPNPTDYLKGKTIRVVIGSTAVTGDTYLTADLVTRHISAKYDCNIKVDPIGAGRALEEIVSAKPDGNTIMMFHDMTYLGVLFGAYEEDDYKLEKMVVGGSFGYSTTECFAATASAPYKTIAEMGKWMNDNPNEIVKIAVEAGGVSQLGFNGIYEWVRATYGESVSSRLKVFVTGSTDQKLQALWDGNCQVIYAAATAVQEYTKEGVEDQLKLNVIGLIAGERYQDYNWPTFAEQGITLDGKPFVFNKEYFVFYPVGIPDEFVAAMDAAMEAVCNSDKYKDDIKNLGYMPQFKGSKEAEKHIYEKRDVFSKLIAGGPNFDDVVA